MDKIERGNFIWKDGIKDSEVVWEANDNGRFLLANYPLEKTAFNEDTK